MRLELKPINYVCILLGIIIFTLDFVFFLGLIQEFGSKKWFFNPILVLGLLTIIAPFISDFFKETKRQKELELKFLELIR